MPGLDALHTLHVLLHLIFTTNEGGPISTFTHEVKGQPVWEPLAWEMAGVEGGLEICFCLQAGWRRTRS